MRGWKCHTCGELRLTVTRAETEDSWALHIARHVADRPVAEEAR